MIALPELKLNEPKPGEIWLCRRTSHRGWRVKVLSRNATRVAFEVLDGPRNALHRRQRLPTEAFVNCFQRVK